jgi:uncharacterized protein YbbK (DUF523 family)
LIVERILVSACLLGAKVRYHGGDASSSHPTLRRWWEEGRLVPVCPEVDGGLPTPRPAAEIAGSGGGATVIALLAPVRTASGADVTGAFVTGARRALETAQQQGIRLAILKDGSPSCGSSFVYDGSFSGRRVTGVGVTTALLRANGVQVFSETEIDAAEAWLEESRGLPTGNVWEQAQTECQELERTEQEEDGRRHDRTNGSSPTSADAKPKQ